MHGWTRRDWLTGAASAGAAALLPSPGRAAEPPAAPPVIDTHTHFYDPSRPQGVPWPAKGHAVLDRTVLPDEWERLVAPLGVTGTVIVEASPWVEDNQWLLDLAAAHRPAAGMLGIVGIVGHLPLGDPACAGLIDRFAKHPLYRGIRVRPDTLGPRLADEAVRADLGRLAAADLSVDLVGPTGLATAAAVAAAVPDLRVIVDHMGAARMGPDGVEAGWRDAVATAARHDRVFLKVSALMESAAPAAADRRAPRDPAFYTPWLDAVWDAFGDGRLLFGSNWPVSDTAGTYAEVLAIVQPYVRARGPEAERQFFAGAARAAYRWVG
jgi:L-fuconolactonase